MGINRGLRIRKTQVTTPHDRAMQKQSTKNWRYDWRQKVGVRPTESNSELFHRYVEMANELLEDYSSADFVYSEVRQVCQPQYLFQVVLEMRSEKLSMVIRNTEEGLRVISIHKG